jgi:hypothetical protein
MPLDRICSHVGSTRTSSLELQSYGEVVPYKIFPAKGGLLPFAMTDNGDVLYWIVVGDPDEWRVVVNESRSSEWQEFNLPFDAFMSGLLSGSVVCRFFPSAISRVPVTFDVSSI